MYTATVREDPHLVTFGATRGEALAQLREELAAKVGPAPGSVEEVN